MADPRRYIGVRISEQGHRYIQLVAGRDRINYSEALRRLLALGAKTDMEAHDGTDPRAGVERSAHVDHVRQDDGAGDRHFDGDRGSGEVPHVPDSGPAGASQGIPEAIGVLIHAGLHPATVEAESDGPSAA